MTYHAARRKSWPKQAAIVVSESPNIHMLLREMLRSYEWTVIDTVPSVQKAAAAIREGLANLVVVDDTPTVPAVAHIRYLMTDPITILTPTLAFLSETNFQESPAMLKMGRPGIVEKPLTPSKFLPGFVNLVKMWERPAHIALRQANYMVQSGNVAGGIRTMIKLRDQPDLIHLTTQALALHLRSMGKIKEAEALLINTLKSASKDLGTIIALADLYMHVAMPALAHRLLLGATNAYGQTVAVYPDLMQAALMKGSADLAISYLELLHRKGYMPDMTSTFLARLLFSEGQYAEAERVLNNNRATFNKMRSGWVDAESDSVEAAG